HDYRWGKGFRSRPDHRGAVPPGGPDRLPGRVEPARTGRSGRPAAPRARAERPMTAAGSGGTRAHGSWLVAAPGMASAWVSDIGHQRARQEDRAAVGANFVVVADGVGSIPGGAEAAQV